MSDCVLYAGVCFLFYVGGCCFVYMNVFMLYVYTGVFVFVCRCVFLFRMHRGVFFFAYEFVLSDGWFLSYTCAFFIFVCMIVVCPYACVCFFVCRNVFFFIYRWVCFRRQECFCFRLHARFFRLHVVFLFSCAGAFFVRVYVDFFLCLQVCVFLSFV